MSRLLPAAGIALPAEMPLADRLVEVQRLMAQGDPRARRIYEAIGIYLGYGVAHFADFYAIESVLVLGPRDVGRGRRPDRRDCRARAEGRVPGARRADPPAHAGRAGEAPRPGDRRRQPARGWQGAGRPAAVAARTLAPQASSALTRGTRCASRDRTPTSSCRTAPRCRRRCGAPRTSASAPTRTTRSSWPSTASPSASGARTRPMPASSSRTAAAARAPASTPTTRTRR